jgi:hypothetical protein
MTPSMVMFSLTIRSRTFVRRHSFRRYAADIACPTLSPGSSVDGRVATDGDLTDLVWELRP